MLPACGKTVAVTTTGVLIIAVGSTVADDILAASALAINAGLTVTVADTAGVIAGGAAVTVAVTVGTTTAAALTVGSAAPTALI